MRSDDMQKMKTCCSAGQDVGSGMVQKAAWTPVEYCTPHALLSVS